MKYIFEAVKSYVLLGCLIAVIAIQVSTSFIRDNFSLALTALGAFVIFYLGSLYGRKQEKEDGRGE